MNLPPAILQWCAATLTLLVLAWTTDVLICRFHWKKYARRISFPHFCLGLGGTWHLRLRSDLSKVFGLRFKLSGDEISAIEGELRRREFADFNFWRVVACGVWAFILTLILIVLGAPPPWNPDMPIAGIT